MQRLLVCVCTFIVVGIFPMPAGIAVASAQQRHEVNWNNRDTAMYVVSTLNLLRSRSGRPVCTRLTRRSHVQRFEVWADTTEDDLYFILLKRDDGAVAGTLAYEMGWSKPRSVSSLTDKWGIQRAPDSVIQGYKIDSKQFLGSFTSTLPT